jgi:hypothetical protein
MKRTPMLRIAALALAACACTPAPAPPENPSAAAQTADPRIRQHVGAFYADFIQRPGMERYAPTALGLDQDTRRRFESAMLAGRPAAIVSGGGTSALVLTGCRSDACADDQGVMAVDLGTGAVFVGVKDELGADVLVRHDRLQALLEAISPRHEWSSPPPGSQPVSDLRR